MLHSFLSFSTLPLPSFLSSCLHPLMSQHIPSHFLPSSSPYFKHSSSQLIFSTQCPPPLNLPSLSPFHLPSLSLSLPLPLPYLQLSLPPSSPPSPTSSSLPLPYLQLSLPPSSPPSPTSSSLPLPYLQLSPPPLPPALSPSLLSLPPSPSPTSSSPPIVEH